MPFVSETDFTVMALGAWLCSSPVTFGYHSRSMTASDLLSGALLVVSSGLALWPRFDFVGRWGAALVGVWLQFAPLVFWAPRRRHTSTIRWWARWRSRSRSWFP